MEDDLNFFDKGRRPQKTMQPKTSKSKNNGCGTAPGNLVYMYNHLKTLPYYSGP